MVWHAKPFSPGLQTQADRRRIEQVASQGLVEEPVLQAPDGMDVAFTNHSNESFCRPVNQLVPDRPQYGV